jgi:folate-binding protein YgfZ
VAAENLLTPGYEALRRGAAWLDLSARGRLIARGRDRARFLHNVSSNDIKGLKPGSGCYAFLLTPQGRIQADLYIFCFPEHFLIDTEPETREQARAQILRYKVADQIELEDVTDRTAAIGVEGPGAAAVLAGLGVPIPGEYQHLYWNGHTVAGITETGQPGVRIYTATEQRDEVIRQLEGAGVVPASADEVRTVRIENGKPRYGEDIVETSLPQETRQMHAVSFTKGCYLGQEIVERIRARGHVNRQLVRIQVEGQELPARGSTVPYDTGEAEVTSAAYSPDLGRAIALGYARVAPGA